MPDHLDSLLSAIADPTRRGILAHLSRHGPTAITGMAGLFPLTLPGFSKHVVVLEQAGLVKRTKRGREHIITISPKPLQEVAQWVLQYEPFWNEKLDRLQTFFARKDKPK